MRTRPLGNLTVSAIGLGAMELSIHGRPPEADAVRTVHAAIDLGVTLIDTADAYSLSLDDMGHNERLLAKALASYGGDASDVLVATKGGHVRTADGGWDVDGRPAYLKEACERSLKALGVEAIGLYQYHRPDPNVPYAESVGALAELLDEGKIRLAGVSNADPEQIRTAEDVLGGRLASVQNESSPRFRSSDPELHLCDERGIAFLPWSPLGGMNDAARLGASHSAFATVAERHGVSAHQVCLAWHLARSPVVIPIPGCRRVATITDSAAAANLQLSAEDLAELG